MEVPTKYRDVGTLCAYLQARLVDPSLPSPVFKGHYPVCAEGLHKYYYRVPPFPLESGFDPDKSVFLPVIPLRDVNDEPCPKVTIATGTRTSKNARLNDKVVAYPAGEPIK